MKKNNILIIILGVVILAVGIFIGFLINNNSTDNDKPEEKEKENLVQIEDSEDTSVDEEGYIGIKTKYLSKTLKGYNIRLAKKVEGEDTYYALYDADNKKLITDYDYKDGPYAKFRTEEEKDIIFDVVEKISNISVFHSNGKDYLFIYVVASGHADGVSYGAIYEPLSGNLTKVNTTGNLTFKDECFILQVTSGHDDISHGWYYDYASEDGSLKDVLLVIKDGKYTKLQASFVVVNSDQTYTLFTMPKQDEYKNANYSNSKAVVYDATGKEIRKFNNVVSVGDFYIITQESGKLVLNGTDGSSMSVEENTNTDYIYLPYFEIEYDTIKLKRQNKSNYDDHEENGSETLEVSIK